MLPTKRNIVDEMVHRHYLRCWPGVCVAILGMFSEKGPVGCIIFALPPRETAKRYGGVTWELARLWIEDHIGTNAESWLIAKGVRYVRQTFQEVKYLVSYADPSRGHSGVVYKASNWLSDGRTDEERKTPRFDYEVDGKRYSRRAHVPSGVEIRRVPRVSKYRFYYPLHRF